MISCARFRYARTGIQAFVRVQQKLDAATCHSWPVFEARFHILRLMEFVNFGERHHVFLLLGVSEDS